ncbi:hypothetical protein [Moorena sp. SIO4G3]|uniref:hypothetical protein n=1 Tax=Moorena sp. SIO4G3 TaxID=2607821 RepID=UPI001429C87D|nr:hypothetical protein [Moorena sp. SIO4G3]NEO82246.1 hypothetical protein [Moorena sp. SIO4G3]
MNKYLDQLFQSYSYGRSKPLPKIDNIDDILDKRMQMTMIAHLPLEDIISIKKIFHASQAVLSASFQGKLLEAEQANLTANKIIKFSQFTPESSLIIKNTFNASKGYFDYRQGNYDGARVNLHIALEACIALINQYGYDFLQGRPIHLACNLLKVEACSGNHEKAIKIACYLISHMEGKHNSSLAQDINLLESVQDLSFNYERFLVIQVFEEVAKLFASCNDDESTKLVALASNIIGDEDFLSNKQFQREYTWFKNKQALAKGKIIEFIEESSKFLADGRGSCTLLWHATVLDILKICKTIDSEISKILQKQIIEDLVNYKYLPTVLKA